MQTRKVFQTDGINLRSGVVIQREDLVRRIIDTAEIHQHVVLSSPPATGNTSLVMLIQAELKGRSNEGPVYIFTPRQIGDSTELLSLIQAKQIPTNDLSELQHVTKTWIIIDDAQRGYRSEYEDLWTFLVKDLPHGLLSMMHREDTAPNTRIYGHSSSRICHTTQLSK
jgi:hypothetical protein